MKVLITNSVVFNTGEAATATSIVALMRRVFGEQVECIIYDQSAAVTQQYYPELKLRTLLYNRVSWRPRVPVLGRMIASLMRARFMAAVRLWAAGRRGLANALLTAEERIDLENYATADLVVSTGGTYLVDNYNLDPRIFDYHVTLKLNRPLVLFTQSLGPLEKPRNRQRLKPIFEQAKLILLRDETSRSHLKAMAVQNPNIHLSADAVFVMRNGHSSNRIESREVQARRPRVAISVRHWPYFKNSPVARGMAAYRQALIESLSHLVKAHNAEIVFISSCQGIPEYWFDDSAVALQIKSELDPVVQEHVSVDRAFRGPQELIQELANFDLVIATRFHMAIFAMLAGTPTLGVAYEFKTQELLTKFGLPEMVLDIENVSSQSLNAAIDRLLAADANMLAQMDRAVESEQVAVFEAGEMLRRVAVAHAG